MHYLVYHSSDNDGHCGGAIMAHYCELKDIAYELIPYNYGNEFPWHKIAPMDTVMMADISIQPYTEMQRLATMCRELVWIDHHKTAIEAVEQMNLFLPGRREIGKSGAELAWEYLFPETETPWFVQLVGRYDVWDNGVADSNRDKQMRWQETVLPFQYYLKSQKTDPRYSKLWQKLFTDKFPVETESELIKTGKSLYGYEMVTNKIYLKSYGYERQWEGLRVFVCNKGMTNSLLFDAVANEGYDMFVAYADTGDFYRVTLFGSKNSHVDCSAIATKYGGGGHVGAAGFQCISLPWK